MAQKGRETVVWLRNRFMGYVMGGCAMIELHGGARAHYQYA